MTVDFQEGKHYKKIQSPFVGPRVVEYFSFYCPHCYRFEPLMKQLDTDLHKQGLSLTKVPVNSPGGTMARELQRAFALAWLLGMESSVSQKAFAVIHQGKREPAGPAEIEQWFTQAGVTEAERKALENSFLLEGLFGSYDAQFMALNLSSVPAIIVDNQYQLLMKDIKSKEQFIELVSYLLKK